MDQLKNIAGKLGNSSNTNTGNAGVAGNTGATGSTGNTAAGQDYGDKAFAAAEKNFGYNGNAETNEKITDGIRGEFEKLTGKKVPEKFSN